MQHFIEMKPLRQNLQYLKLKDYDGKKVEVIENLKKKRKRFCAIKITPIWPTHQSFWWKDKMGPVIVVFIIEMSSITC